MKGNLKRGLSVLMAAVLAFSFTGCGKKKDSGSDLIEKASVASKDYVFSAEEINVEGLPEDVNRVFMGGDRVYLSSMSNDKYMEIASFNPDGSDLKTVKLPRVSSDSAYSYYDSISVDKDGNIYAIYEEYHYDPSDFEIYSDTEDVEGDSDETSYVLDEEAGEESSEEASQELSEEVSEEPAEEASEEGSLEDSDDVGNGDAGDYVNGDFYYLVKYDKDGNNIYRIDLNEKYADADGNIVVNDMIATDDGIVVFSINDNIIRYTDDEGFKAIYENAQADGYNYFDFYKGFNNQIFVSYYGEKGTCLSTFDVRGGKVGKASESIGGNGDFSFFGGNGYDLYISDTEAFYGYDLASDSKTKLVDYVDSDIELTGSTSQVVAISDVEFIACIMDLDYNFKTYRLKKVPPENVKEKTIITLAGYCLDYDTRRYVSAFNKENSEYKIKAIDYYSYDEESENYGKGAEMLNMDIVSGNTPDIIMLGTEMPVESYINKGLLEDLTPYFAKDPDISESDMITNIFDAFKTNGKIYQVVPAFTIGTMAMKAKYAEGKNTITFDECKKLIEQTGVNGQNAFGLITREEFLQNGIQYAGNSYIDWENKTCHFDSDAFIDFLEYSNQFMAEIPESAYEDSKDTVYLSDESLFSITTLYTFREFKENTQGYFGTDVAYIGYPNNFGVNNSIINPTLRAGISTQSKNKDAAWEFLKIYYSDKYQEDLYNFPITKKYFEKQAKAATERPFYEDDGEKVYYDEYCYVGSQDIKLRPMTQEEVTDVENFIKSLSFVYSYNQNVDNIIFEEASAFYSGQKSAKEVADIIQSRVSIYVNENS